MHNVDLTDVSNLTFDGNGHGSGSAIPSAEPLSAAVREPASLVRLALAMSTGALAGPPQVRFNESPTHSLVESK